MYQTIDTASSFRDEFRACGRADQFSYEALGLVFAYFEQYEDDTGEPVELDVIAICCEWSEESPSDIARNYSIDLNDASPEDDDYEEQCLAMVLDYVSNNTTVAGVTKAGDIVYVAF
jgi:hypothetical protein